MQEVAVTTKITSLSLANKISIVLMMNRQSPFLYLNSKILKMSKFRTLIKKKPFELPMTSKKGLKSSSTSSTFILISKDIMLPQINSKKTLLFKTTMMNISIKQTMTFLKMKACLIPKKRHKISKRIIKIWINSKLQSNIPSRRALRVSVPINRKASKTL